MVENKDNQRIQNEIDKLQNINILLIENNHYIENQKLLNDRLKT